MRNWDEELVEDRQFVLGGELFEWIYPHWEIGAKLFDGEMDATPEVDENGKQKFSWQADTKMAIERIPLFLNPKNDSHKRFKALAARKTDAVPRYQFAQVYTWLVQVTGGLPTSPPSTSANGGGTTDAESSDVSSSTEATPAA